MRFIWLPLCCVLAGVTQTQADTYRDKDEGFNPMNVMQGMPNPMNMFDSSNRDDYSRHRPPPPPPPRMAPGYPYPAPPGYAAPPVPRAPYYAVPNTQPPMQETPSSATFPPAQTEIGSSAEPAETPSYGMTPPAAGATQAPSPVMPEAEQPAYSFRPMTPPDQASANAPMTTEQPGAGNPASPPENSLEVPASGQTVITEPYPEQNTPMVNGQPAVFRPMGLGAESPPAQ